MSKNPLIEIAHHGQSIWLDLISRRLLDSGDLERLIHDDQLKGVTSNPSIFEKAIAKTNDYDESIFALTAKENLSVQSLYEQLAIADIKRACDLLRPVYDHSQGRDGYACLEVSPHLAHDAELSIEEGRRLWRQVDRPNLMVKIPGTTPAMTAIRTLISEGINVNVTLLFSVESYRNAAQAFLQGLNDRAEKGLAISSVHSVASFFISRIDSKVDAELSRISQDSTDSSRKQLADSLLGKIAIANAKLAFVSFTEIYRSDLAKRLTQLGAHPQRLLWASTSTKNANFSDILYVETLIGKETVNTLPLETLIAFRDHGHASSSLEQNLAEAESAIAQLKTLGLDFAKMCDELQTEGVELFVKSFDQLLASVEHKLAQKSR